MSQNRTHVPGDGGVHGGMGAGTVFAGHRIEAEIGRGGMGVVYRARHLVLDRELGGRLGGYGVAGHQAGQRSGGGAGTKRASARR